MPAATSEALDRRTCDQRRNKQSNKRSHGDVLLQEGHRPYAVSISEDLKIRMHSELSHATLPLPPILCLRLSDRLPLEIRDAIGCAANQRLKMVPDITGARASRSARRGARVLTLELVRYLTRPILAC